MERIALVTSADRKPPGAFDGLDGFVCTDATEIGPDTAARWQGLIVTMHADQRALAARAAHLQALLVGGGRILFNGHHVYPVFAGCGAFEPLLVRGMAELALAAVAEHPLFTAVDRAALARRKGVAGFYGRGAVPPPAAAQPITTIGPEGWAVDWHWPVGRGALFMHAGNDLWTTAEAKADQRRLAANALAWCAGDL